MLYVIPSSASGAAATIVSRSFWSAERRSSGRDPRYAATLFGFSIVPSTGRLVNRLVRQESGVELDDQPLFDRDRERDLVALGQTGHRALELVGVAVQVRGRVGRELDRLVHVDEVLGLVRELDRVLGLDLRAGHVEAAAVQLHVAVADELAGLALGEREPEPQDHGVQTGLELADELLAGDGALAARPLVVRAHLAFADPVDVAELLLLEQADLVLGEALAAPPVHAGGVGALGRRAVRAPTQGDAGAAAHPMTRSDFVHSDQQGYQRA